MLDRKLNIFFVVVFFILANIPSALCISSAPTIYVSGDGSGDFNCNATNAALKINEALQFVAENSNYTTVYLKGPFTYIINDNLLIGNSTTLAGDSNATIKLVSNANWTIDKPLIKERSLGSHDITVRGFTIDGNREGNTNVISGKGYYNLIYLTRCQNITVRDMYLTNNHGDGLKIDYCTNTKLYNNKVYELGHDVLYATYCSDIEAFNNNITCRTNSGLRLYNSNNASFHDNVITSNNGGGAGIQIQKWGTPAMNNIEVYNNTIYRTALAGIWIFGSKSYPSSTANVHIHNNRIYDTGTKTSNNVIGGILSDGFNALIENNVIDGVYGAGIVQNNVYSPGPDGSGYVLTVRNNIITNTRTSTAGGYGYGICNQLTANHSFFLQNNCLYNNAGGDYEGAQASPSDIEVDPQYADRINHDYRLKSKAGRWDGYGWVNDSISSPCIDAGNPLSDFSNEPEPNGNRINIGPDGNTIYASKSELNLAKPTLPSANFSSNVTSGYAPLSVQFTDLSKNTTGWYWDFGDGSNSTLPNPMHIYSAAGNYTVNLTAINVNGTNSKIASIDVLKAAGTYAYITNYNDSSVSVIDTATNTVTATLKVGARPFGTAVNSQGTKLYVTNPYGSNTVSVIDIAKNAVIATVPVGGNSPHGIAVTPDGKKAYVTNCESNNVSVIDTTTNNVTTTVNVGSYPIGVAVTPDGNKIYVANYKNNSVSAIDTATNTVIATVPVGNNPYGIAANPQGTKMYVTNYNSNSVSVIDTATNKVIATVKVGGLPYEVAVNLQGTKGYVTNYWSNTVSVFDTTTNTVKATIPVGKGPHGVAVNPEGTKVYVTNWDGGSVSVIDTTTNTVSATVKAGSMPSSFGNFIASLP